ncbi:VWA domain-containing protein [Halioglobus sp. HI00S01]|uniref:VWA domain-containing protein n=1 Tax=Halioglobus sp. HI00S01 TaxID=1822214 RepID=UPI000B0B72B8|nr:VWA domain-containing protein [Halioglobus sp. HI00S01]
MSFHLLRPEWLWAALPALLLAAALWHRARSAGNWESVIAPELLAPLLDGDRNRARRNVAPAILIIWLLATFAAAGPSWHQIPQPIHQTEDALVVVLDLSYSMVAADLEPSRIDRARQKLLDLLARRDEGQTGLIAYAGDAHIVTPLTDDTPTIANLLPALHPTIMPVPGSDPASAVAEAVLLLQSAGIRDGSILLVTDGIGDRDLPALQDSLNGSTATLAIMGVGTPTGAPLPLPRGGFLKDPQGGIVMPGLEERNLRGAASDAGGRYMRMQIDDSDLDYLLAEDELTLGTRTTELERTADTWEDQGYWLVVLLLIPALLMFRRGWLMGLAPLIFMPAAEQAHASLWDDLWLTRDQQGQRALQQDDPETAATLFKNRDWAGTAAYRGGDYERAAQDFASNDTADAWYNRGNALARAGQLDEAAAAYRESLRRDPDAEDAQQNLELVENLQQQQEQQQQQSSEDQGDEGSGQQPEQSPPEDQQEPGDSQGDQSPSDNASEPGEQDANEDSQESADASEQEDQQQGREDQGNPQDPTQQSPGDELMNMAQQAATDDDLERDQAMEQWLRRVPDDPSGLLREKFRYESRQRQQQGQGTKDETYW